MDVDFYHKHNVRPRNMIFDKNVAMSFFATEDIPVKTELRYDYGSKVVGLWKKEQYPCLSRKKETSRPKNAPVYKNHVRQN